MYCLEVRQNESATGVFVKSRSRLLCMGVACLLVVLFCRSCFCQQTDGQSPSNTDTTAKLTFDVVVTWDLDGQQIVQGSMSLDRGGLKVQSQSAPQPTAFLPACSLDKQTITFLPPATAQPTDTLPRSTLPKSTLGKLSLRFETTLDARLNVDMQFSDGSHISSLIPIAELLTGGWVSSDRGPRLSIDRNERDRFRFQSIETNCILEAGTVWQASLAGHYTGLEPGQYMLSLQVVDGSESRQRVLQLPVSVDSTGGFAEIPLVIPVPSEEGPYRLQVELKPRRALRIPLTSAPTTVRLTEFIVFNSARIPSETLAWEILQSIHAYSASRIGIRSWFPPLSGAADLNLAEGWRSLNPLANGGRVRLSAVDTESRTLRLRSPAPKDNRCLMLGSGEWISLPFGPLQQRVPHRLRIRIPNDQPSELIARLVTADGQTTKHIAADPWATDFRILVGPRDCENPATLREFDFLFWPESEFSSILLLNAASGQSASLYDLSIERAIVSDAKTAFNVGNDDAQGRVAANQTDSNPLGGTTEQPAPPEQRSILVSRERKSSPSGRDSDSGPIFRERSDSAARNTSQRYAGLYIESSLVDESPETEGTDGEVSASRWRDWAEVCSRLDVLLDWTAANLLVIGIDASPTSQANPEPTAPSLGVEPLGFPGDKPPTSTDRLHLLLKHCERAGVACVLALDFDRPLPALEKQVESSRNIADEIYQGTVEGKRHASRYDPLHPAVQASIRTQVENILRQYGKHPAFQGIQLQLDRDSHLVYCGDKWGYSPLLLGAFEQERRIDLPDDPTQLESLLQGIHGRAFLQWRSKKLAAFFASIDDLIRKECPTANLYLNPVRLWEAQIDERDFQQPAAIVRNPDDYMLSLGIDAEALRSHSRIVFLQGRLIQPADTINSDTWIRAVAQVRGLAVKADKNDPLASLIIQPPGWIRWQPNPATETSSGESSAVSLLPVTISPTQSLRKHLIEQLYQNDVHWLACGSQLPIASQTGELRRFFRTLRELPSIRLHDVPQSLFANGGSNQSNLKLRTTTFEGSTYLQLINNSPWAEKLALKLQSTKHPISVRLLGEEDEIRSQGSAIKSISEQGQIWQLQLSLDPYDLIGIEVPDEQLRILEIVHSPSSSVLTQIRSDLSTIESILAKSSTRQVSWANIFGDFERWDQAGRPYAWKLSDARGVRISRSVELPHSGRASLQLENEGHGYGAAWIQSRTFDAPETGRLAVQAWFRCPTADPTAAIRLSIQGTLSNGQQYERSIDVGSTAQSGTRLPNDWGTNPVSLFATDIPVAELDRLSVKVELLGTGVVWIDDIQVMQNWLRPDERIYLQGQMLVAKEALDQNNPFPAEQLLDSHWGRFLAKFHPSLKDGENRQNATREAKADSKNESAPRTSWNDRPRLLDQMRQAVRDRLRR